MNRVKGKVVIVTGGALGIGQATCLLFADEGASVAVTDVCDDAGAELVDEIRQQGGTAAFWKLDVSKESVVKEVFRSIRDQFKRIDVLINNAGISGTEKPTHEVTESEWDRVMAINVKGTFFCTKHVVPYMRQQGGGAIINLSSIYGIVGAADIPPYHASKGAIRLMTKTDALLYAKDRIRVNSVHPGFIWTPMVEDLSERWTTTAEESRRNLELLHPIGHLGDPEDVAYAILYLASEEAKFVTGSELVVDGGYTAR